MSERHLGFDLNQGWANLFNLPKQISSCVFEKGIFDGAINNSEVNSLNEGLLIEVAVCRIQNLL